MSDSLPASMKAMEAEAQELRVLVKAQEDEKSELSNEIQVGAVGPVGRCLS